MTKWFHGVLSLLLLIVAARPADAQQEGKISGYMFGDYYYVAADHVPAFEKQNGFWFRRVYVTYDKGLSPEFTTRFRIEMNSPGDFGATSIKLTPIVKDAYVKWTRTRQNILFGMSASPTWEVVERIWGYRSVEKTPLDLQRMGGSRDFGIAFQGAVDPNKKLNYHFMFGNGSDTGSEVDKEKKVYLSLTAAPVKGLTIEAYTDWEGRPADKDRYVFQGFISYERPDFRAGAQIAQQTRKSGTTAPDTKLRLASVFAAGKLAPKAWALVRFDRTFDLNPDGNKIPYIPFATNAKSSLFIVGLDLLPVKDVHIIPNIEAVVYGSAVGPKPGNDTIPRLTLYYTF
ncbi:MAG: hypothetical protein HY710_11240 [Candidatus Latescibacteria bacterium]|nr:hypothetical protein [Candidatus Latescibacterota bacterium]